MSISLNPVNEYKDQEEFSGSYKKVLIDYHTFNLRSPIKKMFFYRKSLFIIEDKAISRSILRNWNEISE